MKIVVEVARLYAALGYHVGLHGDAHLDNLIMDAQSLMVRMANHLERFGVKDIDEIVPLDVPPGEVL